MNTLKVASQTDFIGALAGGLCFAHCLGTPLLFDSYTEHVNGYHTHPLWWGLMDILFIGISFAVVYWCSKNSSKGWVKLVLWSSWVLLTVVNLNEKISLMPLAETFLYFPSIVLVVLHPYNRKCFQCGDEKCCSNSNVSTAISD